MIARRSAVCSLLWLMAISSSQAALAAPKTKASAGSGTSAAKAQKPSAAKAASTQTEAPNAQNSQAADSGAGSARNPGEASKADAVQAAGTTAAKPPEATNVNVKVDKGGVKTYEFGAVEVEGRLKSPQVIYFLRRVRAEFDAGALGHRSFLGELSDSRRSAAFR
jgi:cobalamin biosynthesis Mg chelatase CobN